MLIFGILTALVLLVISGLHVYWALGGRWGGDVVIPSRPSSVALLRPAPTMALVIAGALAVAALLVLGNFFWPSAWVKLGTWSLATMMLLRSVGEFRYVGLFKTVRDTPFARYDTAYFTPLCLALGLTSAWIAYLA